MSAIPAPSLHLALTLRSSRHRRNETFGTLVDGFGEPGWDMLLELFVQDAAGRAADADALIAAGGAGPTVGRRYIEWLVSHRLAVPATDGGGFQLGDLGRERMLAYLEHEMARAPA